MTRFIPRRTLAAAFGVQTATVAFWDRNKSGVGGRGPIYVNSKSVVYREEDVEAFLKSKDLPLSFVTPQEKVAARAAASPSPQGRVARPRTRPTARSGSTEATSAVVGGHGDEGAPAVRPEPEVEP